jgi:hypothetical protein
MWLAMQLVRSNQIQDTYFIMPGASILLIFGVGVAGDLAFRSRAMRFGRRAVVIWRTHLLFTSALVLAALAAATQAEMTSPALILVLATTPLLLVAHGTALAAGGVVVLRTT